MLRILFMFLSILSFSQFKIDSDKAFLEIVGDNTNRSGILLPNVSLSSISSLSPLPVNTEIGTIVYNTSNAVGLGYFYWNGVKWSTLNLNQNIWSNSGDVFTDILGNSYYSENDFIGSFSIDVNTFEDTDGDPNKYFGQTLNSTLVDISPDIEDKEKKNSYTYTVDGNQNSTSITFKKIPKDDGTIFKIYSNDITIPSGLSIISSNDGDKVITFSGSLNVSDGDKIEIRSYQDFKDPIWKFNKDPNVETKYFGTDANDPSPFFMASNGLPAFMFYNYHFVSMKTEIQRTDSSSNPWFAPNLSFFDCPSTGMSVDVSWSNNNNGKGRSISDTGRGIGKVSDNFDSSLLKFKVDNEDVIESSDELFTINNSLEVKISDNTLLHNISNDTSVSIDHIKKVLHLEPLSTLPAWNGPTHKHKLICVWDSGRAKLYYGEKNKWTLLN
jgi:hypothetical protein